MNALKPKFRAWGGVHPRYEKALTRDGAVETMPVPDLLSVSLSQHLGAPASPTVKRGDTVSRGDRIGEPVGFISAAVHAPTSGKVKAVAEAVTASGARVMSIDIVPDGEDRWREDLQPQPEWEQLDRSALLKCVAEAGVTGMGGAGFPTHIKLSPPQEKPIDTLIINGAECEPYLTADHRLMVEESANIWAGVRIIRQILGAEQVYIAIEDNKPEAIEAMQAAIGKPAENIEIVALKTEYPQGAEKQQIYAITGREVPSGGLPMDVGCVVENVGTTLAVWDAVVNGRPLTERVTTVTGSPVARPANVKARLGTSYAQLIEFCGGLTSPAAKVISGGPMMGLAQHSLDATTTKTTSGLVALPPELAPPYESGPCISCGRCVQACPMNLLPSELSQFLEAEDYESAEEYDVLDCIECGCCAFVCPSHRPMVQHMRRGKTTAMLRRRQEQIKQQKKDS